MNWLHPQLGEIREMHRDEQEVKGWKHLYAPQEQWEQLTGVPAETLHSQARANGCGPWRLPEKRGHPRLGGACRSCLYRHHDRIWREAYGEALMDPRSRIGADRLWTGTPTVLASPRGVWLVLRPTGDRVFNAFRPHQLGKKVYWSEEDFAREAERRFRNRTSTAMSDRTRQLRRQVARPADVWHLALLVAEAQADPRPEEHTAVQDALATLAALPEPLRRDALPDEAVLVDALDGLLDAPLDDPNEAIDVVLAIEDALVGTEVLLGQAEAGRLREAVEGVAAWAPASWLALQHVVDTRELEVVGVAREWWQTFSDVLAALEVGEAPRVHAPQASLVDGLTAPPWWTRWATLVAEVSRGLLEPRALGLRVGVGHLGGADEWEVSVPQLPASTQVFVVDAEHPEGEDVSEDAWSGGAIWLLEEPGQEACVVRIDGVPRTSSLAAALAQASDDPEAQVQVSLVSRPS